MPIAKVSHAHAVAADWSDDDMKKALLAPVAGALRSSAHCDEVKAQRQSGCLPHAAMKVDDAR